MSAPRRRTLTPVLAIALLSSVYAWAVFTSTFVKPGSIGIDYAGPGTDWMVLYGAERLGLAGQVATLLDGTALTGFLNSTYDAWLWHPLYYRPFVYPPSILTLLLPFAGLGFFSSFVAFQVASAALMVGALLWRTGRTQDARAVAASALICPAASINAVSGQLAFLVAGLLVLGLRLLPRRPFLAGAVLGLLSVKPQFALLVPAMLLARWQWAGVLGAVASALALAAGSAAVFGMPIWWSWIVQVLGGLNDAQAPWVTFGRLWGSSVYACAVLLGVPAQAASWLQVTTSVAAAAATVVAMRAPMGEDQRLATVLACVFLAAPHSAMYDTLLLTVAASLWLARQAQPGAVHRTALLGFWLLALIGPPALVPVGRLAPLFVAGFIGVLLRPAPAPGQPGR